MLSIQERLALLTEPIEGAAWQWACMLRCAVPGIVVSFDSDKQTCVVQPAIQELVLQPAPGANNSTQNIPVSVTIQPIQDVPIIMMQAGDFIITLPIQQGTECLLIFADMCIDGWWANGGVNAQYDRRRHDLSDAFALFGPWSQPNVVSEYSTTNLEIRSTDGTVNISVGSSGITLKGPVTQVIPSDSSGTPQALVLEAWYTWFTTHIYPFLTGLGYSGPAAPTTSVTSILVAE